MMNKRLSLAAIAVALSFSSASSAALECDGKDGVCDVKAHDKADAAVAVRQAEVATDLAQALEKFPALRQQLATLITQGMQENQQAAKQVAVDHAIIDRAAPFVGNKDGKLVIVEYFDNRCPYCKALAPLLARAVAEYTDLKLVYKEYAILGPQSQAIARGAIAAHKQGKYIAFHDELMRDSTEEKDPFPETHIVAIAEKVGLDISSFKTDMSSQETASRLTDLTNEGRLIGVRGTPGLLVGGKVVSVVVGVTPDQFKATGKIIDEQKTYDNLKAALVAARAAQNVPRS